MDERYSKILDAYTQGRVNAVSYSIEVASDNLKYSSWIGALATAGVVFIITNFDKIVSDSWIVRNIAVYGAIAAAACLFVAIILTGFINQKVNHQMRYLRILASLLEKQKFLLLTKDEIKEDIDKFVRNIFRMDYLSEQEKETYTSFTTDEINLRSLYSRLLIIQQIFIAMGYIVAFICAIKPPYK